MQRFQQFWIFIAVVSQIFDRPKITVDNWGSTILEHANSTEREWLCMQTKLEKFIGENQDFDAIKLSWQGLPSQKASEQR